MPKTYKNILIIKMSSLGDIIHALPSLYALRKVYPDARITWAVHPAFAGILPGKPWIDEVYLSTGSASISSPTGERSAKTCMRITSTSSSTCR